MLTCVWFPIESHTVFRFCGPLEVVDVGVGLSGTSPGTDDDVDVALVEAVAGFTLETDVGFGSIAGAATTAAAAVDFSSAVAGLLTDVVVPMSAPTLRASSVGAVIVATPGLMRRYCTPLPATWTALIWPCCAILYRLGGRITCVLEPSDVWMVTFCFSDDEDDEVVGGSGGGGAVAFDNAV